MTFRGHVENGQIILDEPGQLPEGAVVSIQLLRTETPDSIHPEVRKFSGILPSAITQTDYYEALARKHL